MGDDPGLGGWAEVGNFWGEPILYQKLMVWTILFEVLGLGASSGPLAFKFSPMIGGSLYWSRRNTLRVAPWPGKCPSPTGDHRTTWDVTLYGLIVANLVYAARHARRQHAIGFPAAKPA